MNEKWDKFTVGWCIARWIFNDLVSVFILWWEIFIIAGDAHKNKRFQADQIPHHKKKWELCKKSPNLLSHDFSILSLQTWAAQNWAKFNYLIVDSALLPFVVECVSTSHSFVWTSRSKSKLRLIINDSRKRLMRKHKQLKANCSKFAAICMSSWCRAKSYTKTKAKRERQ